VGNGVKKGREIGDRTEIELCSWRSATSSIVLNFGELDGARRRNRGVREKKEGGPMWADFSSMSMWRKRKALSTLRDKVGLGVNATL